MVLSYNFVKHHFVYCLLIPGNGASFTKIIERLLRGVWTPTSIETLQPSLYVKQICIILKIVLHLFYLLQYY